MGFVVCCADDAAVAIVADIDSDVVAVVAVGVDDTAFAIVADVAADILADVAVGVDVAAAGAVAFAAAVEVALAFTEYPLFNAKEGHTKMGRL